MKKEGKKVKAEQYKNTQGIMTTSSVSLTCLKFSPLFQNHFGTVTKVLTIPLLSILRKCWARGEGGKKTLGEMHSVTKYDNRYS